MDWLERIINYWSLRNVEGVDVLEAERGYILEYDDKIKYFEDSEELLSYYNNNIKDWLDREPISVIGNIDENMKKRIRKSGDSGVAKTDEGWAVDVFNTANNYSSNASGKAIKDVSYTIRFDPSRKDSDLEEEIDKYFAEMAELDHLDPQERFEKHTINALSATITQAIIEKETGKGRGTDLDYIIEELEKLEE